VRRRLPSILPDTIFGFEADPMVDRLTLCVLLVTVVVLARCDGAPETAPDLSGLNLGMSYPAAVTLARGECEHVHDRGVRQLEWHYDDGSLIEATILDGRLSGLEYEDGTAPRGRSIAAVRVRAGLQPDTPETSLRQRFGDHAVTTDDTSDRECRWSYDDGTLTAIFMHGRLEQASWQEEGHDEPVAWVEVDDPVVLLVDSLASERRSDRYRALYFLERIEDPRVAEALVDLLRIETDRRIRGMAARLLADAGDLRASDLLLPDLEDDPIPDEIIDALARIGDARAEAVLRWTQERIDDDGKKRKIQQARKSIDRRIGRDWPPARNR
jgi:hypothetical protein